MGKDREKMGGQLGLDFWESIHLLDLTENGNVVAGTLCWLVGSRLHPSPVGNQVPDSSSAGGFMSTLAPAILSRALSAVNSNFREHDGSSVEAA